MALGFFPMAPIALLQNFVLSKAAQCDLWVLGEKRSGVSLQDKTLMVQPRKFPVVLLSFLPQ